MFIKSTLLSLKKIVAPRLSPFGFEYSGKLDSISWVFERHTGDTTHFVIFEKIGSNPNCMRFMLRTSVSREIIMHHRLANELDPFGLMYTDDTSFHAALETLINVIIDRGGLDWLAIMSRPDVIPSKEIYAKFMDQIELRQSTFIKFHNLTYNDSYFMDKLENVIRTYSNNGIKEPDWEFIMDAAVAMGEYIRMCFGGEWKITGKYQRPSLCNIGGLENKKLNCLALVSCYWARPDYEPDSIKKIFYRIHKSIVK